MSRVEQKQKFPAIAPARFILASDKIFQKFYRECEYNRFKSHSKSENLSDFEYNQ